MIPGHLTDLEFCCRTIMSTQIASRKASDLDPRSLPGQQQFLVREPPLFPDREHYGQGVEHFSERDQGFTNLATLSADLASPSATAFRLPPSSPPLPLPSRLTYCHESPFGFPIPYAGTNRIRELHLLYCHSPGYCAETRASNV